MAFSKRKGPSQVDIAGFWTRNQGESLTGKLTKFVPNDKAGPKKAKPFFIFEITVPGKTTMVVTEEGKKEVTRQVKAGEYVGVSANWSIRSVVDNVADLGKTMRLTVTGTAPNPNGGKDMILIDVEVDEDTSQGED